MPKNVQTTTQLHSFHMLASSCSKSSELDFKQYVNQELPGVQLGFRKVRGTRDQTANIHWIRETAREFQENVTSASLTTLKPFDCVDHNKL